MASLGDLYITVGAKIEGFRAAMSEVASGIDGAGGAFKSFGESATQWIERPLDSAKSALGGILETMGPVGVATGVVAAGFALVAKEIGGMVLEAGEAVESTSNLAAQLNLSFGETRKLSDMALIAGVSLGTLGRVSMALADALEDPAGRGKKVAEALDGMGISATNSGDALLQVLQKLSEIPDATERIAKAHEIMGRGAVQLEPLLKDYTALSAAVDELGGKLSKETIDKLMAADDAADKLSISWRNLKEAISGTFAAPVGGVLDMLTKLLTDGPKLSFLETSWSGIAQEAKKAAVEIKEASKSNEYFAAQSREYNRAIDESNKSQEAAAKAAAKHREELEKLAKDALKKATEETKKITDAFHDMGLELGGSGGVTSKLDKMESAVKLIERAWQDGKVPITDYVRAMNALHEEANKTKVKELEGQVKLLNQQYKDGLISTREYTSGQKALTDQIAALSPKIQAVKQSAEAFDEELAKLDEAVRSNTTVTGLAEAQAVLLQSALEGFKAEGPVKAMGDLSEAVDDGLTEATDRFATFATDVGDSVSMFMRGSISSLLGGPGSIGEKFKGMVGNMREAMLDAFLKPIEDALQNFISGTIADLLGGKGFGGVLDGIKDIGSAIGGVFGKSAGTVGDIAGGAPAPSQLPGVGGAGSAAGAATGGLASIFGAIGSIGSMVSGIIGNFQFMGMNKSLDVIVLHTLQTANDLANLRKDSWDREGHLFAKLDDWRNFLQLQMDTLIQTVRSGGDWLFEITSALQAQQLSLDSMVTANGGVMGGITIDMRGSTFLNDRQKDELLDELVNRLKQRNA